MRLAPFPEDALFIGGRWRRAESAERVTVVNPATEQVIGRVPDAGAADVDAAVRAARASFDDGGWKERPPHDRAKILLSDRKSVV